MQFNDTLTELVRQALEVNATPALMGEPGIGKSSFVEALAASMNTKAFVLPCNQLADKADLTGARLVPYTKADGTESFKQVFYPHHVIQEAIDYAEANPRDWPILFLDEINRTTADVTSGALTLVTLRKMGHITLPDNLRIMVAGNDRGNTTTLDEASLSRFAIFRVEPDANTLINVLGANLNPWVKKVLTENRSLVFQKSTPEAIVTDGDDDDDAGNVSMADLFDGSEEMNQLTTPRTIDNVSRWLQKADRKQLATYLATPVHHENRESTMLHEAIEAYVGNTQFCVKLVAVIADDLANNATGGASSLIAAPRPNCYSDLKTATTITELASKIDDLTDNEKSGALVTALNENDDNSRLIEQLAEALPMLEPAHLPTLINMVSQQQINKSNLEALLGTSTAIADALRPTLSAFVN